MPTLFLIDGNSQMYRAYHAIRGLTAPDGRSTNAVFGFATMLRKLISDQQPEFIAASFDAPGPTFRTELSADYKANRPSMPADLVEQVPLVHEACAALGVPTLVQAGFEADDVIGTIAARATEAGFDVAIVTGDKDFFQLVGGGVRVFNPRDEGTWYDEARVKEKFGVTPAQVVDTLALMGDATDNVKGVPGIGEKGARDLMAAYGSLDRLLEQAGAVPQKKHRDALVAHGDLARQSRQLVRIRTDVPLELDLEAFRHRGASRERCYQLFSLLGFRSLLADYAPSADTIEKRYVAVGSVDELEASARELRAARRFAFYVLAEGASAMRGTLVGIAFSTAPRRAWYLPLGHTSLDSVGQVPLERALAILKPIIEDPSLAKVGHDLKSHALVLARYGLELGGLETDTMLASYVLDATRPDHEIEPISLELLGYRALTEEEVRGKGAKAISPAQMPIDAIIDYAGERADLALQLAGRLGPALAGEGLGRVYRELELPLIPVLMAIERAGVRLDAAVLADLSQRIDRELSDRRTRIVEMAGLEFNINSPKQLSDVLFEKLKLPTLKRTGKTRTASTAVEVLEELALLHDLPREILEWRGLQKLKGTYIDALPAVVDPDTGRVHTSFNQAVAATGRLSSSDPNLQNIPIRTALGREIRRAFIADPGHVLISADYSQIELRVLAHLSGDGALIEAFRRGDDIHDQTALRVFGTDSGLGKHELRRRAKVINYALLYGKTAFTLARDIGVPQHAAQSFIDAYFAGFPRVRAFIDQTLERARQAGSVTTMFGRRRLVPELNSRNGPIRSAAERVAINMPIQGTAADILKRAMIDVHHRLEERTAGGARPARMILTVHDELLFEAPTEDAEEIAALVRDRMSAAASLDVPLTVDVGIGENWKDAKG